MHPSISTLHKCLQCQEAIEELEQCHKQKTFAKFVGACNQAKASLDKCLSDQYLVMRELNAQKSRKEKARLKKILAEDNQNPV